MHAELSDTAILGCTLRLHCEGRTLLKQFLVGAALGDGAMLQHHHLVRVLHRAQPVRDAQHGPADGGAVERLLHRRLALRVQRARRLRDMTDT